MGKWGNGMAKRRVTKARAQLDLLRDQAAGCTNCDLYRRATQTVFGAGPAPARLMFVGEQPGDAEDKAGEPFVGPAGRLFREALMEAGIDPADVYITNAVKHFKWKPQGKRRLHERPNHEEVMACRMWLDSEIALVRPKAIVALGATAASVIAGPSVRVTRDRARRLTSSLAPYVTVTVHPSSVLRTPDDAGRRAARRAFVGDLKKILKAIAKL
jgi:uracil-DNA glycosylase family protein